MDSEFDYVFKLILVGDCAVGKSSLILRFADDTFFENYSQTIAIDLKIRTIELQGKVIKLQIWDTSGEERYRSITSTYYRGAHGVIAVYDVTKRQTFDHVNEWFDEVDRYTKSDTQKLLLGNKCDLVKDKVIAPSVAKSYADGLGIQFLETSAKDSANVEQAFEIMATQLLSSIESAALKPSSTSVSIDPKTKPVQSSFFYWC